MSDTRNATFNDRSYNRGYQAGLRRCGKLRKRLDELERPRQATKDEAAEWLLRAAEVFENAARIIFEMEANKAEEPQASMKDNETDQADKL